MCFLTVRYQLPHGHMGRAGPEISLHDSYGRAVLLDKLKVSFFLSFSPLITKNYKT